jgi:hypothetical protein
MGKTVRGKFVDPDGKPLTGGRVTGSIGARFYTPDLPTAEFTIPAINPDAPKPYFFVHAKRNLAVAVVLKGDEPDGLTVKLQPAATIAGRLLDAGGEPLADVDIMGQFEPGQLGVMTGWGGFFNGKTDHEGRFRITGIVPDVKLGARVSRRPRQGELIFEGRSFRAGEERDLGDVRVKTE